MKKLLAGIRKRRRERYRGELRRIHVKDDQNVYVFPNHLALPRVGEYIAPDKSVMLRVIDVQHDVVKREKPYINADVINIITESV
jgi:hypothetical protein